MHDGHEGNGDDDDVMMTRQALKDLKRNLQNLNRAAAAPDALDPRSSPLAKFGA
jgi:hypothetical protein